MHDDIKSLIEFRIQQANETIKEVEFQIENNYLRIAVNRVYYGMFYSLLALSLKFNFKSSKHNQLLGWFNKEFVKTGKVNRNIGKIIHKAFEERTDSDYGVFVEFEKNEVIEMYNDMKTFIKEITQLVSVV